MQGLFQVEYYWSCKYVWGYSFKTFLRNFVCINSCCLNLSYTTTVFPQASQSSSIKQIEKKKKHSQQVKWIDILFINTIKLTRTREN